MTEDMHSAEHAGETYDTVCALADALAHFTLMKKFYPKSASLTPLKARLDTLSRTVRHGVCFAVIDTTLESLARQSAHRLQRISINYSAIQRVVKNLYAWAEEYAPHDRRVARYAPIMRMLEAVALFKRATEELMHLEGENRSNRSMLEHIYVQLESSRELVESVVRPGAQQKKLLGKVPWNDVLAQRIARSQRRIAFLLNEAPTENPTQIDENDRQ